MTHLLVDLGNTRSKIARAQGNNEVTDVFRVPTGDTQALSGYVDQLAASGMKTWMASVAGAEATASVVALIERRTATPVQEVRAADPVPFVTSGYRNPEQLGVDRLLAMVAARAHLAAPVCVVDAGTAVTIDLVDASGQHLGGFILPGLKMMRDSLLANTSIPADAEAETGAELGRDTATAVALGARYAIAGVVERFAGGASQLTANSTLQVVIGGGDAEALIEFLPAGCIRLEHLVLRGLAVVAASGSG